MKKMFVFLSLLIPVAMATAQSGKLPLKEWSSSSHNVFVLYISGDGGLNSFSTELCTSINHAGYAVTALNARSYFWEKQSPEQAAQDITAYLLKQLQKKTFSQLVLVGYSFGADVLPFIVNRIPDQLQSKLRAVILLSPSTSTDFEVHLSDMLGQKKKRSMNVAAEINQMNTQKIISIFGTEENDFPIKAITLKNYNNEYLPGGHHFDGNPDEVVKTMLKYFR